MQCPYCKEQNVDKVIDSRATEGGRVIRRRRQCLTCNKRFTTYERVEELNRLAVVKKDGSRAPFERGKILTSLQRACYKRQIPIVELQRVADEVEEEIFRAFDREVPSRFIGGRVAARLRDIDRVAYLRFASVYNEFQDVNDFIQEAQDLLDRARRDSPGQQELFNP